MKTLVAKTERERPKHPKLTEGIWPIDLEHLDQERIRRSNFPTPSIIRKALKPPLLPSNCAKHVHATYRCSQNRALNFPARKWTRGNRDDT